MIDRLILIALRDKTRFQTLRRAIPDQMLDGLTVNLLNWYEVYWNQFDHQYLDTEALLTMMKLRANMDESQLAMVQVRLPKMRGSATPSPLKALVMILRLMGKLLVAASFLHFALEAIIKLQLNLL